MVETQNDYVFYSYRAESYRPITIKAGEFYQNTGGFYGADDIIIGNYGISLTTSTNYNNPTAILNKGLFRFVGNYNNIKQIGITIDDPFITSSAHSSEMIYLPEGQSIQLTENEVMYQSGTGSQARIKVEVARRTYNGPCYYSKQQDNYVNLNYKGAIFQVYISNTLIDRVEIIN